MQRELFAMNNKKLVIPSCFQKKVKLEKNQHFRCISFQTRQNLFKLVNILRTLCFLSFGKVREKFGALEKQLNALQLLVGGTTSSGVITRPKEKLDLSTGKYSGLCRIKHFQIVPLGSGSFIPLACLKNQLNGGGSSDETKKTEAVS